MDDDDDDEGDSCTSGSEDEYLSNNNSFCLPLPREKENTKYGSGVHLLKKRRASIILCKKTWSDVALVFTGFMYRKTG